MSEADYDEWKLKYINLGEKVEGLKERIKELEEGITFIWNILDTMNDINNVLDMSHKCKVLLAKREGK